jgi:hypothetical protein
VPQKPPPGKVPQASIEMTDFPGMIDNQDRLDLPPGTADEQVNATCVTVGELQVRLGMRQVTFEN